MEPKRVEVYKNRRHNKEDLDFGGWFICNLYDRSEDSSDNYALVVATKTGKTHQVDYDCVKFLGMNRW